jgi:hypothetical protein
VSTREPPRSRPFLMEFLIVLALVWAGAQWLRRAPEAEAILSQGLIEPRATGSIPAASREREAGKPDHPADIEPTAVKSVMEALGVLGRR